MRKIGFLFLLLVSVYPAMAQIASGAGYPPFACSATLLTQTYKDTNTNLVYTCVNLANVGYIWQLGQSPILPVTNAPSGSCTVGMPNQQVVNSGTQYSCQNGTWGAIGGGGALPNPATSAFYDEGGAVFNVKAYGAKGDGTTNDCTAIGNALAAANVAGGNLFFPQGNYFVSTACHLTASGDVTVSGVGKCSRDLTQCSSVIVSTDTSGVLFTNTGKVGLYKDIAILNLAATAPTAGSAILTNGTDAGQIVDYRGIFVSGFYIDVDVQVGAQWSMETSYIQNPVLVGVRVQNTINHDAGDWRIIGTYFAAGAPSNPRTTPTAGVEWLSSSGGTLLSNKFVTDGGANFTNDILVNLVANSAQGWIVDNSVEGVPGGPALQFTNAGANFEIWGNYLKSGANSSAIYVDGSGVGGLSQTIIGGGSMALSSGSAVAITLQHSNNVTILPFLQSGYSANSTILTCGAACLDITQLPTLPIAANSGSTQFTGVVTGTNINTGYYHNYVASNDWVLGSNAYYNGSAWFATLATASSMENAAGAIRFRVDTGLTPNSTFAPTVKFTINSDGTVQPGSNYKSSDGTAGFTGTCASTTTLTVKNGLITGCS